MTGELRDTFAELEERVAERTVELRAAKETADEANEAKSRFLASLSHEIRTPLAAILGWAEILRNPSRDDDARQALTTIRRSGRHLDQLLSDLIDVSRIEAGRLELVVRSCELDEILGHLRSVFEPLATERGLSFTIDTSQAVPWRFDADPGRLRQVLSNLLGNAIKYTDDGGVRVVVTAEADDGDDGEARLFFAVEDTGPGIPEAERAGLFERFRRRSKDEAEARPGFGLGLAIVLELTELMDGHVTVTSDETGSSFRVEIPVRGYSEWQQRQPAETPRAATNLAGLQPLAGRLLVADDSAELRELSRRMLVSWGLDTTTAADGREAVAAAADGSFDIILMDWQMPILDGLQATSELRRRGVTTPVLALTAAAQLGDRERCLESGCDGYLAKPIDFRDLHRTLRVLLDRPAMATTPVNDLELADLVRAYVARLPEQIAEMRSFLAEERLDAVAKKAHGLAGTAGTMGLDRVYRTAGELEKCALDDDAVAVEACLERLVAAIDECSPDPTAMDAPRRPRWNAREKAQRVALAEALERCGWMADEAARELGISRATVYRRMKKYGLDRT